MKQKKEESLQLKNALADLGQRKWREKSTINSVNYQYFEKQLRTFLWK